MEVLVADIEAIFLEQYVFEQTWQRQEPTESLQVAPVELSRAQ